MNYPLLSDIVTTNKTVLLLCDFAEAFDEFGTIVNKLHIQKYFNTINYLIKSGTRVVLCTNIYNKDQKIISTKAIADYLNRSLRTKVLFLNEINTIDARRQIFRINYGDIIVLENLAFHKGEMECKYDFAVELTEGMNLFVNEYVNKKHQYASNTLVPFLIRSCIGFEYAKIHNNS